MSELMIEDEAAMRALGARLAHACPPRCVVYLIGDLGAGKTTLVRGFLGALGHAAAVRSPTYTIVEPYELGGRQVYHLDLYRLTDPGELEFLGLRDWLAEPAVLLVEWPDHGTGVLPPADLILRLTHADTARQVSFESTSTVGQRLLMAM